MPRKRKQSLQAPEQTQSLLSELCWLKAVYHFHVFHYRMPQTAAIAAITPFVPSPLTVKFAMVASLLQLGRYSEAEALARALPKIEVRIVPPLAAFSFKAFLRYRSVPAVESAGELDESGSFYPSRPHTREYSLFQGDLIVFVGIYQDAQSVALDALKNIRYLGCKDSLVWCKEVLPVNQPDMQASVQPLKEQQPGAVVLLADVKQGITLELRQIIPGRRDESHYVHQPYTLYGSIRTSGRTKVFQRQN
ncbi:MAG: hypothetical protein QXS54_12420 [Candidatus Methanomethylicaceae archaeon]